MLVWNKNRLGAAGATQVVLFHGAESTKKLLEDALPGSRAVVIRREGSTTAYNEVTGIGKEYPTLRGLLAKFAPEWRPGDRLVVLGYSAGAYALRYYLRDLQARSDISTAIFLDGLYGAPENKCDFAPYAGVIAYGKMSGKQLIMTYSQAHPAPKICSEAIAAQVSGAQVVGAANKDHAAQQTVVAPEVLRTLVATRSGVLNSVKSRWPVYLGLSVAAFGVAYWKGWFR